MKHENKCEYGHECTSRCQNDIECPCLSEHWCSMSDQHTIEECKGLCGIKRHREHKFNK